MLTPTPAPKQLLEAIAEYYHGDWGFSGSRYGINDFQKTIVRRVLEAGQPNHLNHGGAYGADFEMHGIWREVCPTSSATVWPMSDADASRYMYVNHSGDPRTGVAGNMTQDDQEKAILIRSKFLFICPQHAHEMKISRTWSLTRRAITTNKPVLIIWPNEKLTLHLERALLRVEY